MITEARTTQPPTPLDIKATSLFLPDKLVQTTVAWARDSRKVLVRAEAGKAQIDPRYENLVRVAIDNGHPEVPEEARRALVEQYLGLVGSSELAITPSTVETIARVQQWARPQFQAVIEGAGTKPGLKTFEGRLERARIAKTLPFANLNHRIHDKIEEEIKKRESDPSKLADRATGRSITDKSIAIGEVEELAMTNLPERQMMDIYFTSTRLVAKIVDDAQGSRAFVEMGFEEVVAQSMFEREARRGRLECIAKLGFLDAYYKSLKSQPGADVAMVTFLGSIDEIKALTLIEIEKEVVSCINTKLEFIASERAKKAKVKSEQQVVKPSYVDPAAHNDYLRRATGSYDGVVDSLDEDVLVIAEVQHDQTAPAITEKKSLLRQIRDSAKARKEEREAAERAREREYEKQEWSYYLRTGRTRQEWLDDVRKRLQDSQK